MKKLSGLLVLCLFVLVGCEQQEITTPSDELRLKMTEVNLLSPRSSGQTLEELVANMNAALAEYDIQVEKIEYFGAEQMGSTVFFNNRGNKQLGSDFVPNDPRNGNGTDVPYAVDGTQLGTSSGMSEQATLDAINSAMATWEDVTCSGGLNIPFVGVAGFDLGFAEFFFTGGASGLNGFFPGWIVHAGILPASFFDLIATNGGDFILGATFTLSWANGDIDNDGRGDVALKEIYYNDGFNWQDEPNDGLGNGIIDFETVVLHEVGHGLSQGHFGKASITQSNGKLHFSPYALMNAGYTQARREVIETDEAGHCSNWGNWPNN